MKLFDEAANQIEGEYKIKELMTIASDVLLNIVIPVALDLPDIDLKTIKILKSKIIYFVKEKGQRIIRRVVLFLLDLSAPKVQSLIDENIYKDENINRDAVINRDEKINQEV